MSGPSERQRLVTNTGDKPFIISYASRQWIFNPNPKLKSETWHIVDEQEEVVSELLSGRKMKVKANKRVPKVLSEKPGPYRHYVPESMLSLIFQGINMSSTPPPFMDARALILDEQAIEQAEAQLDVSEKLLVKANKELDEAQKKLEAMQAQIAAFEGKAKSDGSVKKILEQDGIKVPSSGKVVGGT